MRASDLYKLYVIIVAGLYTSTAYTETLDYLTRFKVPLQQTFCMSKSLDGDMNVYKECMLAVERSANKCDKETKSTYDVIVNKYGNLDQGVEKYMEEIKPIALKHFECLDTLY